MSLEEAIEEMKSLSPSENAIEVVLSELNNLKKINDEMIDSFYRLYQKRPGTMYKFFENGKPCKYRYDKENNECKEINCKPCIKQYFEKKVGTK